MSQQNECAVCLDKLRDPVTTVCNHVFCEQCLEQSTAVNPTCPICRTHLENFSNEESSEDSDDEDEDLQSVADLFPPAQESFLRNMFRYMEYTTHQTDYGYEVVLKLDNQANWVPLLWYTLVEPSPLLLLDEGVNGVLYLQNGAPPKRLVFCNICKYVSNRYSVVKRHKLVEHLNVPEHLLNAFSLLMEHDLF